MKLHITDSYRNQPSTAELKTSGTVSIIDSEYVYINYVDIPPFDAYSMQFKDNIINKTETMQVLTVRMSQQTLKQIEQELELLHEINTNPQLRQQFSELRTMHALMRNYQL